MSLGYTGMCKKELEDDEIVIYSYSGENWNDGGKSKSGDSLLLDGSFVIHKDCLEEPEIHTKLKKMPSGRKKVIEKRITHTPRLSIYLETKKVYVEKECKNAFRRGATMPIDYIAYRLILHLFERYQVDGELPEIERFIQ
jgi:hypothetical protein